ncbi:Cop1p [Sugiyamaella lignohabitans]|uniref:Coatomer subunit alpha n=1 Tax=Sugiyamaella lignohabitans TaxID=796027 RepID=A0A170QZ78_9ASCO|nr:Cop1p [Sugiyamaella lignohabitans]ANB16004.1 Cop1p [Sugiyamaella lignohabitans]
MGTIIDRFEGHEGPVRGVDFHKTQPLFASCGDDYTINVWSLQTRKRLFTLTGHLDYVRTVFFHNDLPWIISCSDDQTIRIWNWQNRQEIACLTGHNHYVMSAQFHPKEDLIVSASLDQTVRVWDISGLRKRHSAPSGALNTTNAFEDQLARANGPPQDIFGNTDAIVKYVLEGHDRGVNWASFHPTLPLIVSGGDDRVLKIWRMSETKAWELDTCRGHLSNIMCCIFHPFQDLIISVSEDKTIRTWDLNKRTPVQQFKREGDKFWYIAAHESINLFAAAHDSGVMVFKLERERPASTVYQNSIYYINREKQVKFFDINSNNESLPLLSLKKIGSQWVPFRNLSYNPAERQILVTTKSADNQNIFELISLPKDASGAIEPSETSRGSGDQAVFISRNRFAVLLKSSQTIEIRDLGNSITKSVQCPISNVKDIVYGGPGLLLVLGAASVVLFDVQQKKTISEIPVSNIKYAVWSNDGQHLALLGKHTITITTKNLETVSSLHETIRIKSATWDDTGVLIYSTLNHLKYSLLNGDNGILRTLQNTLYMAKVKGNSVYCLARGGSIKVLKIDPTEYRFKKALVSKNFHEVLRLIKSSQLVGQSIIAYLQKKGYPEIALQFVQDAQTKFDLAIECGDLKEAFEQAKELGKPAAWKILGEEALAQGNHDIVEDIYQKQHDFDRLSFVYLATGNIGRLQKMEQIADHRNDTAARFQTSIFLNSVDSRIQLLRDAGLYPLAYSLAKSSGLTEVAREIIEESGVDESAIKISITDTSSDAITGVSHETHKSNWPLRKTSLSFFEQALLGKVEALSLEDEPEQKTNAETANGDFDEYEDELQDEDGWDLGAEDLGIEDVEETDEKVDSNIDITVGSSETELWLRNSPVAADHVAAGSFETAAQLLNRQVGIVNFAPLKKRFLEVYRGSKLYLPANDGLPPLTFYARRPDEKVLPFVHGYESLGETLQEAYKLVASGNQLQLAIETFREILQTIVVLSVPSEAEAKECQKLIEICKNYILAFSIELKRKSLPPTDVKRSLELVAYFTKPKLQKRHAHIPYMVAMKESFSKKNFASASFFASEYIKIMEGVDDDDSDRSVNERVRARNAKNIAQAKALKAKADASPLDAHEIDFDQYADFDICPSTLTPIYEGTSSERDPLTGAKYHVSERGKLCSITQLTSIGAPASGLRLFA